MGLLRAEGEERRGAAAIAREATILRLRSVPIEEQTCRTTGKPRIRGTPTRAALSANERSARLGRGVGGLARGTVVSAHLGRGRIGISYGPRSRAVGSRPRRAGQARVRVLGALAPPLILLAIIQALMHVHVGGHKAWRLAWLLLLNTLVAIGIGLAVANVIQPGRWSHIELADAPEKAATSTNPLSQFLDSVPKSVLGPLGDNGQVLGVIFLAVAFGIALRRVRHDQINTVDDLVRMALAGLLVVLHWVIDIIPLAVFGIVAAIVGVKGLSDFIALGGFVIAVIVALLLQSIYYLARIGWRSWVRPRDVLRGARRDGDGVFDRQLDGHHAGDVRLPARKRRRARGIRQPGGAGGGELQQRRHGTL